MTAVRHGFFMVGFMLCDRCVLNFRCERFVPGGECVFERETFDRVVGEFTEAYGLDLVADRLSVELIAMDVIRLMRVWNYDAVTGFGSDSERTGPYLTRLGRSLRRLLNDLAVSRGKREKSEGLDGLLTDVRQAIEESAPLFEKRGKRRIVRKFARPRFESPLRRAYRMILEDFDLHAAALKGERVGQDSEEGV